LIESINFILIWIVIILLSWILLRASNLSISRLSIPSIVYIFYMSFNYLGLPLLYFYKIDTYYNMGVNDKDIIWELLIMASMCLLLMLLGFLFTREVLDLKADDEKHEYEINNVKIFEIIILLLVCFGIFVHYLKNAYVIPIIELIEGNAVDLKQLRSDVHLFSGKMWRYDLIFKQVLPFISYYLLASTLFRRSPSAVILLISSSVFTAFVSLMNFHKAPIVYYIFGLLLVIIFKKRNRIRLYNMIIPTIIITIIMMGTYVFFMEKRIDTRLVLSPIKRVLTGELASAYFYLKMFPEEHNFLYGKSLPNPGGILYFEHFPTSKRVQDYIKPEYRAKGLHGSSPAVYWADTYANFGITGAFFISFFIGVIIYGIHWFFSKGRVTPLKVATMAWLAIHLSSISLTSLGKFIVDTDFIGILICIVIIKYGSLIRQYCVEATCYDVPWSIK